MGYISANLGAGGVSGEKIFGSQPGLFVEPAPPAPIRSAGAAVQIA